MTETELKQRLSADVEDIEAPSDTLARARAGGARRLRRRRLTAITAGSLAVAAIAAAAVGVPAVRDRADEGPVATPTTITPSVDSFTPQPDDYYASLMTSETRGDLAGDAAFRDQVLAVWHQTQRDREGAEGSPIGGNPWAALRGEPRIYWAGNSPAGRIAILAQRYLVPHPDPKTKYALTGVHTLVGMVGEGTDGRLRWMGLTFPQDANTFPVFDIQDLGKPDNAVVVVTLGRQLGWGARGTSKLTPLTVVDGVAVQMVPADQLETVRIAPLGGR